MQTFSEKSKRILVIGPFPKPVTGQALATEAFAQRMQYNGITVFSVDTARRRFHYRAQSRAFALLDKLINHIGAGARLLGFRGNVYISANSSFGLWLTCLLVLTAKTCGGQVFVHHHSFAHCRYRSWGMICLAKVSSSQDIHLVLCDRMSDALKASIPEIERRFVLSNAGLIYNQSTKNERGAHLSNTVDVKLGFLSNISSEKGIDALEFCINEVFLNESRVSIDIAGPICDDYSRGIVHSLESYWGSRVNYLGPLYGEDKKKFFREIDIFLFPTRYQHEAEPLVLYEAMATGCVCVATDRGCISGQLGDTGFCVDEDEAFMKAFTHAVKEAVNSTRRGFTEQKLRVEKQFTLLINRGCAQIERLLMFLK